MRENRRKVSKSISVETFTEREGLIAFARGSTTTQRAVGAFQLNSATRHKWLEAGKLLAVNASGVVRCPERDDGVLRVRDVVCEADPTMMERYLVCETCGARNVLLMRVPG